MPLPVPAPSAAAMSETVVAQTTAVNAATEAASGSITENPDTGSEYAITAPAGPLGAAGTNSYSSYTYQDQWQRPPMWNAGSALVFGFCLAGLAVLLLLVRSGIKK